MNISLCNVTKEYYLDENTSIKPVQNVNLEIVPGEVIIIIGRSGSGKTTLLNLTAGLIRPTAGEVLLDGRNFHRMTDKELSSLRSRKIGFVFQFPSLIPSLTVLENVLMPAVFTGARDKEDPEKRAKGLLELVGLTDRKNVLPRQLSAGEQKRAVIARALINRPEIILADEPTSDLDEKTEQEIMALLLELRAAGVTFMIVTHSLQLLNYATRSFKMENSSLQALDKSEVITGLNLNSGFQSNIFR